MCQPETKSSEISSTGDSSGERDSSSEVELYVISPEPSSVSESLQSTADPGLPVNPDTADETQAIRTRAPSLLSSVECQR